MKATVASSALGSRHTFCPEQRAVLGHAGVQPTIHSSTVDWKAMAAVLLLNASVGILVCDYRGTIVVANSFAKELARVDPEGKRMAEAASIWGKLFDAADRPLTPSKWPCMSAFRGQAVLSKECYLVRADGMRFDLLFSASLIPALARFVPATLSTLTNITEYRRAQLRLREEAVNRERGRMAEDIHSTVSQGLNAILLFSEAAASEIIEDRDLAQRHIGRAHDVAKECLAEARRSMWTLAPAHVENEDPSRSLSVLAKRFFESTDTEVKLFFPKRARKLPPPIQAALYRIGREALANVFKHAHARRVNIKFSYRNRDVRLSVRDDGRGFVLLPSTDSRVGLGLWSIRERAEQLGGKVTVKSHPGRGTEVVAKLPLYLRPDARGQSLRI